MDVKEFIIPIPWGNIAVKAWGNERNTPVLVAHGYYDNAAAFDQLIPLLPNTFYYMCIDLPGHGKSSSFPPHLPIHMLNVVLTFKIILDYLNREKYVIIAHSWSGHMATLFTQLYPKQVLKLILLDVVYSYPLSVDFFKQFNRDRLDYIVQFNRKMDTVIVPTYTYDIALNKAVQSRTYGKPKKEAVEALFRRSLIPVDNGKFKFSSDPRTKAFINLSYGNHFINELIQEYPITCPILFIIGIDSIPTLPYFKGFLKKLQKENNKCFIRKVQCNHDMHMNQPQVIAPLINAFLIYSNSKL